MVTNIVEILKNNFPQDAVGNSTKVILGYDRAIQKAYNDNSISKEEIFVLDEELDQFLSSPQHVIYDKIVDFNSLQKEVIHFRNKELHNNGIRFALSRNTPNHAREEGKGPTNTFEPLYKKENRLSTLVEDELSAQNGERKPY